MTQCVLITGAGKRLGATTAKLLARQGFFVIIHHHSSQKDAAATLKTIEKEGGNGAILQANLQDKQSYEKLIKQALEFGELKALVNNASLFIKDTLETVDDSSFDQHMTIHLKAPLFLSQHFFAYLKRENKKGFVVNMLDQQVAHPRKSFISYLTSKMALWSLTQNLALAMAPYAQVNGVAPGPVLPAHQGSYTESEEKFNTYATKVPLKESVDPETIAKTVLFLVTMPSITGQMIFVDGGEHLTMPSTSIIQPQKL